MRKDNSITPQSLICAFRDRRFDTSKDAIARFRQLKSKMQEKFLNPIIGFLNTEEHDNIRAWGASVLESIGNDQAFQYLISLLDTTDAGQKEGYPWTRFFALRTVKRIAKKSQRKVVSRLIKKIAKDPKEDRLVFTLARILIALEGDDATERKMKELMDKKDYDLSYYRFFCICRGLQEFPLQGLVNNIMDIAVSCDVPDVQVRAVRALGGYKDNPEVVRILGNVVRFNPHPFIRLSAVESLRKIGNVEAKEDLITALTDSDAEVRFQASQVLKESFLPMEDTVSIIVERALREETEDETNCYYIEALRRIDPDREVCTDTLGTELASEDLERSARAERILIELGGWAAIQKVNQLRSTLETLDKMLANSEQVVKTTFDKTVSQAHFNFYFAMAVNGIIVGLGLVLVIMAIIQGVNQGKLAEWILPGGAGLFGILLTMFFNNPRKNAREDLRALMNVNVIFLGFLRQVNEIDATFKHAYLTGSKFGATNMEQTVTKIEKTIVHTLEMTAQHLSLAKLPVASKDASESTSPH